MPLFIKYKQHWSQVAKTRRSYLCCAYLILQHVIGIAEAKNQMSGKEISVVECNHEIAGKAACVSHPSELHRFTRGPTCAFVALKVRYDVAYNLD